MVRAQLVLRAAAVVAAVPPLVDAAMAGREQKPLGKAQAGDETPKGENPFTDEFNALAKDILGQWNVPGMSIAVVDGDDIFAKGFGLANLPDSAATPETLYYVGSTTKALTAAVLAQLIDTKAYPELSRGWGTPISSIIRDDFVLQDTWATEHITLEDAVSHRTGMARHDGSWHRAINGTQATLKDIVRNLRNLPLSVEPRAEWHYCNFMYLTLSHAIETLTGRWLGDVMRDLIWKPLGMHSTYMDLKGANSSDAPLASSYIWREEDRKYEELPFLEVEQISGAGGIISNVLDFAQWLKCLVHEGEPFSKAVHRDIKTSRSIFSAQPGLGTDVSLYGLGWGRTTIHGQVVYTHAGSTITFGSLVYWLPDAKWGVVALANGAGTSNEAELVLVRRLLEDKLRVPLHERVDVNEPQKQDLRDMQREIERADDILYPDRPKRPSPPSIKPDQLTGKYFNQGYGTIDLFQEQLDANVDKTVLVANRTEMTWPQQWRLHHVSGDYWTLYAKLLFGMNAVLQFHAAEFKIGVDGKVAGLELLMYDRSGNVKEGTILFQKMDD